MAKEVKSGGSKNKNVVIIAVCAFLAVVIVCGTIVFLKMSGGGTPEAVPTEQPYVNTLGVVDENNISDIEKQFEEAQGAFYTDMNMVWTFPNALVRSSDAVYINSPDNTRKVFFSVKLDGEEIIKSKVLDIGQQVPADEIVLLKKLEAGTYEVTCENHLLNDDGTEFSIVNVNLTVVVQA